LEQFLELLAFIYWQMSTIKTLYLLRCLMLLEQSWAILVMLAESMIPEAFEEGGESKIGLATMAGFVVAFVLGRVGSG
jgi:hypothetical protein